MKNATHAFAMLDICPVNGPKSGDVKGEKMKLGEEIKTHSILRIIFASGLISLILIAGCLDKKKDKTDDTVSVNDKEGEKQVDLNLKNDPGNTMESKTIQEQKEEYINDHPELYPEKLRELLGNNPEILDYVYHYPAERRQDVSTDLSKETESSGVPLLMQWDMRWGYKPYAGGMIGYTGCGPTCLSMVALYLTKNSTYSPQYIAMTAENKGFCIEGVGTSWDLMGKGCKLFGLRSKVIPLDENRMIRELENRHPLILSMGKGDFTSSGHFIVIRGYDDGFIVNDPNSRKRSERRWSYEELRGQIKNIWSYEKNISDNYL